MNDDWSLFGTLGIYVAGLALLVAEVFIPSGGVIFVCALGCLVYSIYELFTNGHTVLASTLIPVTLLFGGLLLRWGMRRIGSTANLGDSTATGTQVEAARDMVGEEGTVVTALRPAGSAEFNGRRYPVVSDGGYIEPGAAVKIAQVSGNRIVVRGV